MSRSTFQHAPENTEKCENYMGVYFTVIILNISTAIFLKAHVSPYYCFHIAAREWGLPKATMCIHVEVWFGLDNPSS